MPIPDQARVKELLEPHEEAIRGVVAKGWGRWLSNPERAQLYHRVRACLVHNYMMLDAIPGLPDSEIRVVEGQETALFVVNEELVFRFKKGDVKGLSSNISTQAALDFNDPNENFTLFGIPDLSRVDIVYVLNDLGTKVDEIRVVARDSDCVLWQYPILQTAEAPTSLPIDAPATPLAADAGMRVADAEEADADEAPKQGNDGAR